MSSPAPTKAERNIRRLILSLLPFAALVGVGLLTWSLVIRTQALKEPTYNNRTLSQWLEWHGDAFSPGTAASVNRDQSIAESEIAVRAIGTNAIPYLLRWFQAKDPPITEEIASLLKRQNIYYAGTRHIMAWWGFNILGRQARPAAFVLLSFTRNPDVTVRIRALKCLEQIGPDKETFLPELVRLLNDKESVVRLWAAFYIAQVYPVEAQRLKLYLDYPDLSILLTNSIPNY